MSPSSILSTFQVVCTELSPMWARIEVRGKGPESLEPGELSGLVVGPFCKLAQTLKTRVPLVDPAGPREAKSVTTEHYGWKVATVTDPTGWTPELPAWYEVHLQWKPMAQNPRQSGDGTARLAESAAAVHPCVMRLGLRLLASRRDSFYWNARRWVLRGVGVRDDWHFPADPSSLRETRTTLVVGNVSTAVLDEATHWGVPVLANLSDVGPATDAERLARRVRQLSGWPAVVGALVGPSAQLDQLRAAAPNLLYLQCAGPEVAGDLWPAQRALRGANAPDALVVESSQACDRFTSSGAGPCLAIASGEFAASWEEFRAAVDRLQATLSPRCDLAGYMVLPPENCLGMFDRIC